MNMKIYRTVFHYDFALCTLGKYEVCNSNVNFFTVGGILYIHIFYSDYVAIHLLVVVNKI